MHVYVYLCQNYQIIMAVFISKKLSKLRVVYCVINFMGSAVQCVVLICAMVSSSFPERVFISALGDLVFAYLEAGGRALTILWSESPSGGLFSLL